MAFTHAFPGVVRTSLSHPTSPWLKPFGPLMNALITPFSYSMAESGEYMLSALLSGEKGAFRRGAQGELLENSGSGYFSSEEARKRLWEHSQEATANF